MFHNPKLAPAPDADANVRQYIGDGTPFLRVDNDLEKVLEVFIGHTSIPLKQTVRVPRDANNFDDIEQNMILLDKNDNGDKILLRSLSSNDGIWQKDAQIYVRGEWAKKK